MSKTPVALITGATRGIGRAIVDKLSSEGLSCVMVGSRKESFGPMKKSPPVICRESQWHRGLAIDLAQWPQWTHQDKFDGFHFSTAAGSHTYRCNDGAWPLLDFAPSSELALLVNCAGVTQASPALRCDASEIQQITNVNYLSAVSLCNMAAKRMLRSRKHLSRPPCIVNISSILGDPTAPVLTGTALYGASKAALAQFSRTLAAELARTGIRVHCLSPSLVAQTDMVRTLEDTSRARLQSTFGQFPVQSPQDIASQVWELYGSDV
ncbi:LAQU0S01e08504g1_1 [Lachancea quebecensis]|uniref:LAQU0S01e08504g1_1 n=1 Tax=Lachancea quebecensis TaxID=1654605 RepID=A0A0P1KLH3_9SACH|nr:LAQU0S01e08504g1_1 [Lachancea quebecensis]